MAIKSWDERVAERIAVDIRDDAAALGVQLTPYAAKLLADQQVAAANAAHAAHGQDTSQWTAADWDAMNW